MSEFYVEYDFDGEYYSDGEIPDAGGEFSEKYIDVPVTKDEWISDNQNNLHYFYSFIMDFCNRTGYRYFDKCTFPQFCDLAWNCSSGYTVNERYNYT